MVGDSLYVDSSEDYGGVPPEEIHAITKDILPDGTLICEVVLPRNLPLFERRRLAPKQLIRSTPPPWTSVTLLAHFYGPPRAQISDDIAIVQLTKADRSEAQQYIAMASNIRAMSLRSPSLGFAIATRLPPNVAEWETSKVLRVLRLFKAGGVDVWAGISFGTLTITSAAPSTSHDSPPSSAVSLHDDSTMPYLHGLSDPLPYVPSYDLEPSEVLPLAEFFRKFTAVKLDEDSPMGRALRRLERSYNDNSIDSLTDSMIGLETLIMTPPAQEITYRIGLRVGHLLSSDPRRRLEIKQDMTKAYGQRSKSVHESAPATATTQDLARKTQDYLRNSVKLLLDLPEDIRRYFCENPPSKNQEEKFEKQRNRLFECVISAPNLDEAIAYWHDPEILKAKD